MDAQLHSQLSLVPLPVLPRGTGRVLHHVHAVPCEALRSSLRHVHALSGISTLIPITPNVFIRSLVLMSSLPSVSLRRRTTTIFTGQRRLSSTALLPPQGSLCTESQKTASPTQPAPAAGSEGQCGGQLHGSPFLCAERIAVLKHKHVQTVSVSSALNSAASVPQAGTGQRVQMQWQREHAIPE